MRGLSIDVSGLLKKGGSAETLTITEQLPPVEKGHDPIEVHGPVHVRMTLKEASGKILAEGNLAAEVTLSCGRCLNRYSQPVAQRFSEIYRRPGDIVRDEQVEEEEEREFAIKDNKIDVTSLLQQTLVLSVPFKPLCGESCPGLCPVCGDDLRDGPHDHGLDEDEETGYKAALKRYREQHP